MPSQVQIVNRALRRIGISRFIVDIAEDSTEAMLSNDMWDAELDALLESWDWPWATVRASLNLIESDPNTDWGYSYQYPTDCVRAMRILGTTGMSWTDPIPFEVATKDGDRVIFCNVETPVLQYVSRVTDTTLWSTTFADAMSWRLAAELAGPLSANAGLATRAERMALDSLKMARAHGFNEQQTGAPSDPESIRARS